MKIISEELHNKKKQLEEEAKKIQSKIASINLEIENKQKEKLEFLNDLKNKVVDCANEYNKQAQSLGLDVGVAIIYGDGTKRKEDYDLDDGNADYIVKPNGYKYWFPSTIDC